MRRAFRRLPPLLGLGAACMATPAAALSGLQYVLDAETGLQYQSNPFRYSDAQAAQRDADTVRQLTLRGALVVPLPSERSRLELAGVRTASRYGHYRQLDRGDGHAEAAYRWQAGDLFVGSLSASRDDSLYRYLNRTAPDRDMVHTESRSADLGLRPTEDLTLPILRVSQETVRHDHALNRMRFNLDVDRVQLAGRYTGWRQSAVSAGVSRAEGRFRDRTDDLAALVGREYQDLDAFLDWTWDYSRRTTLAGRLSWLQRRYPGLEDRNTNLPTAYVRGDWAYSVKTQLNAIVWHQPFPNSEDPTVLYTTSTGGQLSAGWKASAKTWVSLTASAENVRNTRFADAASDDSRVYRAGVRVEWQAVRGVVLAVDAWRDRTIAPGPADSFSTNVVRLSLLLRHDNGYEQPERLLWFPECLAPRSIQISACQR